MKLKSLSAFACLFVLALLVMLLASANGAAARKLTLASGTIPYSGRLSDDASQPVADGMYAFMFALYDAADGGNLLWSETQTGAVVKAGAFSVQLGSATPLSQAARTSQGWLVVSVRGPGETGFTALSPRQPLNTAATASASLVSGPTCPHDHFGEAWTSDSTGTAALAGLSVEDTNSAGRGIVGTSNSASAVGVTGQSTSGTGVRGWSTSGTGVYGDSTSGYAMVANGNVRQAPGSGGWVKAMALVSPPSGSITRCYNSQQTTNPSTPSCGIFASDSSGTYTVYFAFNMSDRFISITPVSGSSSAVTAVIDSFPSANAVKVKLSVDSAFFIIIY